MKWKVGFTQCSAEFAYTTTTQLTEFCTVGGESLRNTQVHDKLYMPCSEL